MKLFHFPVICLNKSACLAAGLLLHILFIMPTLYGQDSYAVARENMVKHQIEKKGITHQETLRAMRKVPRHLFVPANQIDYAYRDTPLPIGYNQTISQPYMVAYMTQAIQPQKGMKVLEIGTGSGYQAAILGEIVDSIFTIEIVEPLGNHTTELLHKLGYNNIQVRIGDGFAGWPEHGPYDGIIVTAAAEEIPPSLIDQLSDDGLMVIPLGKPGGIQTLVLAYKEKGKLIKKNLLSVRFVPFVRE